MIRLIVLLWCEYKATSKITWPFSRREKTDKFYMQNEPHLLSPSFLLPLLPPASSLGPLTSPANLSPQSNGSFACKTAPAATQGATTLPLRHLRGPMASPSRAPHRPPQRGGDHSHSDAWSSPPSEPSTAPYSAAHPPSCQSSHSAMSSNLLSYGQPSKPQYIPQFISHWPHPPAHNPPSSQPVCKAAPRAALGSGHRWDVCALNASDAEAAAPSSPVWQRLNGLFPPSPHLQADHFSSQHGRLQPCHRGPLHQLAVARGQKLRSNAVNSPIGIYKAESSNFYTGTGKGKWLVVFFFRSQFL